MASNAGSLPGVLLIVDDDAINRAILENIFSPYYAIAHAADGREGLAAVQRFAGHLCAVLLDVMMPGMDGIEVLRRLQPSKLTQKVPVFLITSEPNAAVMREAYQMGVMDVISKPVIPYVVLKRVQSIIELYQARKSLSNTVATQQSELLRQAEQIILLNAGMVEALATAIEFRSEESGDHVRRIRDITRMLLTQTAMGEGLSREDIDAISVGSVLHDVGKIAIPDAILNKPARLTPEEFTVMKTHTVQGAALLERIPIAADNKTYMYACDIARHHHERWDGRGYPDGLVGEQISPWAQVVSLADVYDALSCRRVYKDPYPREQVARMIRDGSCGVFGPKLLTSFDQIENDLAQMYAQV